MLLFGWSFLLLFGPVSSHVKSYLTFHLKSLMFAYYQLVGQKMLNNKKRMLLVRCCNENLLNYSTVGLQGQYFLGGILLYFLKEENKCRVLFYLSEEREDCATDNVLLLFKSGFLEWLRSLFLGLAIIFK